MKKGLKLLCCIITSIVLACNTALIPAVNVRATEFAALGLYEILQSLLLSAGLRTSGLTNITDMQLNEAAYESLVLTVFQNNPTLAKYLTQADELDQDADFRAELEAAEEGTEFDYGEFKILKDASGINRIYASRELVKEAAKSLESWAGTEENTYTTNSIKMLDESVYTVTYKNVAKVCTNSISDISSYFSSAVTDKLEELGVDDSNAMVVAYGQHSDYQIDFSRYSADVMDNSELLHTGSVVPIFVVPFGYSILFNGVCVSGNLSASRGVFKTQAVIDLGLKKTVEYYSQNLLPYIQMQGGEGIQMILYYPAYDDCEVRTVNFNKLEAGNSLPFYLSPYYVFNYQNGIDNGCMVVDQVYLYDSNKKVQLSQPTITVQNNKISSSYLSSGSGTKYANTDDYVSMEFDATTAETLAGYESLADYVAYTTSLSKQLSDIKDAIEDSTEQNAAQTKEIVASINAQTDALSGGISDVITSVKVQTDAISDVLEATKLQTDAIGDVITGIDETIAAIQDLTITLPSDLTLTIPEEMLNITVQVPDISTEVINQIEVTQDYDALQDVITKSVSGVMADVFVPSEDAVDMTLNNFNDKFGFIDDMKTNIENMQSVIFGIQPSPILKIPIMKPNSKYNYGLGDYIIIDVSWYAPYKKYGDTLILAFLWLAFIWRMFIKLPGIINGTSADIVSMSNAADRYNRSAAGKQKGGD